MNTRRRLIVALGTGALAAPLGAVAQSKRKLLRIGLLWTSVPERKYLDAFRSGLSELGYVEGRTAVLEQKSAENAVPRLEGLASELIASGVDIVVTQGTPAARAVAKATSTIPVVVALGDPVGAGLAATLGRPGRNITGLSILASELNAKRLELVREMNPTVSRVAMLEDVSNTNSQGSSITDTASVQAAAKAMGLVLIVIPVRSADDFEKAFATAGQERAQAVLVSPSPVLSFHNKRLSDLAASRKLPAIFGNPEAVYLGALMSYGPSYAALFQRAATYVDKLAKGAKPETLPIEQPTIFELFVNTKAAKALGLKLPNSILVRADLVNT